LSAHRESTELYARALTNLPAETAAETEAGLLAEYAAEALLLEESELSVDLARRARERFLAAGDRVGAAQALLVLTTMWRWDGHALDERVATLQQAIDELEAEPASERRDAVRLNAYTQLAWASLDDLDLGAARESTAVVVGIAERLVAVPTEFEPELWLATLDVVDGRITAGLDRLSALASSTHRRATETRLIADEELTVTAYREVGFYATLAMEYERGAAELAKGRAFANRVEMTHCGRVMASTDALVAWALGRWGTAEQIARQALADRNRGRTGAISRWALGYVALGRGEHVAARAVLVAARQFGDNAQWPEMTLPALWGLAENALLSGDVDSAIATTDEALAIANRGKGVEDELVPFIVTGVRARLAAGRPEEAAAWLDAVEASVRTRPDVAAPAIEHATGLLRLVAGSLNPAIAALERAAGMWFSKGRIWEASWARLDLAAGLLRANRYVDAAAHLSAVRTTAQELASRPLHERIAELEGVARGRGSERAPWHPLTQREYEIARNVAAGLTNPEIAKVLFLSPKTVSAHVEHILAKLGVARRAEIAAWVTTIRPADRVGARTEDEPVATPS
jgi:DNA-binding CsgD family transcriptional regulator